MPKGLFQFKRMPFGLHRAAATFQRLVDRVCETFMRAYIDDIIVSSSSWEEHFQHLHQVIQALTQASLCKSWLGFRELKYLGYQVEQGCLKKYSTVEKEALAVNWAVKALHYYLLHNPFTLWVDHEPLRWIEHMNDTNARILCWYLSLLPFSFTVCH